MKKLFLFLILLPGLAWAGHFGSSTSGKEATVSWSYTSACDSAWMVFGYDGDAGDPDSANMYDSLKLVHCFSGTGRELCGDGLDLDSIGSHVVRMYCFSGDAVVGIRVGKWEQKATVLTAADVWAEDTGSVALTKYGGAILDYDNYKGAGTGATAQQVWEYAGGRTIDFADSAHLAYYDSTLLEQAAACGSGTGTRTVTITVLDIADSTTAISGFEVAIYDSSSGEPQANGTTNSNGVYTCSLDDETYTVHIKKTPWTLTSPRRFVITANMDSTFYATAFDPGSPASPSKCRVYVTKVTDVGANDLAGCRLAVWIPSRYFPVTYEGSPISPYAIYGVSNTSGYVYVDVYRSADIVAGNGETVKMFMRLTSPNGAQIAQVLAEIPDQANWEIDWPE